MSLERAANVSVVLMILLVVVGGFVFVPKIGNLVDDAKNIGFTDFKAAAYKDDYLILEAVVVGSPSVGWGRVVAYVDAGEVEHEAGDFAEPGLVDDGDLLLIHVPLTCEDQIVQVVESRPGEASRALFIMQVPAREDLGCLLEGVLP